MLNFQMLNSEKNEFFAKKKNMFAGMKCTISRRPRLNECTIFAAKEVGGTIASYSASWVWRSATSPGRAAVCCSRSATAAEACAAASRIAGSLWRRTKEGFVGEKRPNGHKKQGVVGNT